MHDVGRVVARLFLSLVAGLILTFQASAPAMASAGSAPTAERLTIVVPGTSGGGWDLTAQAMKRALEEAGIVRDVDIVRYPGAGGLVGISQFVANHRGNPDTILVGGLVMLGATMRDEAAVTLRDIVPIARIAGEWGVIAVPRESELRDVAHLAEVMARKGDALRWAGGALGGPDQGLVWSIANSLGVPLDYVPYYGRPGGRRVAESLIQGRHDVGVGGYAEFAEFVRAGKLRILGVAAPRRVPGIHAPTLRESGLHISVMNWRAVFAAPGLSPTQQARLGAIIDRMVRSETWKQQLQSHRWSDTYLSSHPFALFLDREQKKWPELINPPMNRPSRIGEIGQQLNTIPVEFAAVGTIAALIVGVAVRRDKVRSAVRTRELETRCRVLLDQMAGQPAETMKLVRDRIFGDFNEWKLSSAEQDIAWFMLRGLPLREIADLRGTSERTVRQQAQAIYRKAGLEGRSDLAGRVLEQFI